MTVAGDDAQQTFLPWLRRGLATALTADGATFDGARASLRVAVELEHTVEPRGAPPRVDAHTAVVTLPMFGPADVTGLDARTIVRMWPRPEVSDVESTFLPLVEFAEPDLPWRYTPAHAADGRLRPWLCLLAITEEEGTLTPATQDRPQATLTLPASTPLPDLENAWAWAHIHVTAPLDTTPLADALEQLLARAPSRVVARLLCPRRLEPRKRYTLAIVPTYDPSTGGPAWPATARSAALTLPVYHHWQFGTGVEGDFTTLAQRLSVCADMPAEVGRRTIDLRGAAPWLHAMRGATPTTELALDAALEPVRATPPTREPVELVGDGAARSLSALLDELTPTLLQRDARPLVGPPAYGCWYNTWAALPDRLSADDAPWVASLNLDLSRRIAAGIGTRVVQEQQQALMAGAWAQLGALRHVDEALRFAQTSREATRRIWRRDVGPMSTETLLGFTAPSHTRIVAGEGTVRAALEKSPIDPAVFDMAWRRLTRPRGPLGRRLRRKQDIALPLLEGLNRGTLTVSRPATRPAALPTAIELLGGQADAGRRAALEGSSLLGQVLLGLTPASGALQRMQDNATAGRSLRTPDDLLDVLRDATPDDGSRDAFVALARLLGTPPSPPPPPRPIDLEGLAESVRAGIDPAYTIPRALHARLRWSGDRVRQTGSDPLGPVMAYPEFPQPMYEPLRDLSSEWMLPGLDKVPRNSVSLLRPNRAFLEAYMVGLNHEMARELLWQGYPTDQRGTYFRRFWRTLAATPDAPPAMDITEIHRWQRDTKEGSHEDGAPVGAVFLVRGDLLQRFPSASLYLVRDPDSRTETVEFPSFVGTMPPDVTFVGFSRAAESLTVAGSPWYFAIQEAATETRFQPPSGTGTGYVRATDGTSATVAAERAYTPIRLLLETRSFLAPPAPTSTTPDTGGIPAS